MYAAPTVDETEERIEEVRVNLRRDVRRRKKVFQSSAGGPAGELVRGDGALDDVGTDEAALSSAEASRLEGNEDWVDVDT